MWGRVAIVLGSLAVLVVAPAAAQPAGEAAGRIVDFEILPPGDPVTAGDIVTFTNEGARPHTVTDRGGTFDTDPILPGEEGRLTLAVPGTYEVFCRINPSRMNATIVVEAGPADPTEVRVQAFDENREGETKRFDPAELSVEAGTAITLANVGGLPHTITAADGSFSSGVVEPGAEQGRFAGSSATVVVNDPGTYEFFCDIHPQAMRGTLVVTGDPPDDEVTTTTRAGPDEDAAQNAAAAERASVDIVDLAFEPSEVAVAPGGEVVWTNTGDLPHTATFDDLDLDTDRIEPGSDATLVAPSEPGTYSYFCAIHSSMRGAMLVPPPPADGEGAAPETPAAGGAGDGGDDGGGGAEIFAYAVAVILVGTAGLAILRVVRSRPA